MAQKSLTDAQFARTNASFVSKIEDIPQGKYNGIVYPTVNNKKLSIYLNLILEDHNQYFCISSFNFKQIEDFIKTSDIKEEGTKIEYLRSGKKIKLTILK